LSATDGRELDSVATAHDVSVKGFKVETSADLKSGQEVAFRLELPAGAAVKGLARVVWTKREPYALWAGVEYSRITWSDKRRLSALVSPPTVDWERLLDTAVRAASAIVVLAALQRVAFHRPDVRETLIALSPKILAAFVAAWALLALLRPRR
jgi:hypothetical protein